MVFNPLWSSECSAAICGAIGLNKMPCNTKTLHYHCLHNKDIIKFAELLEWSWGTPAAWTIFEWLNFASSKCTYKKFRLHHTPMRKWVIALSHWPSYRCKKIAAKQMNIKLWIYTLKPLKNLPNTQQANLCFYLDRKLGYLMLASHMPSLLWSAFIKLQRTHTHTIHQKSESWVLQLLKFIKFLV